MISEVTIVRIEAIAEASLALMRDRKRFGTATAAMIKIIITTISNSISENPLWLRLIFKAPGHLRMLGHYPSYKRAYAQ